MFRSRLLPAFLVSAMMLTSIPIAGAADYADMSIVKQGPATITVGSTLSYTLTAKNFGPAAATSVSIFDNVPAGLTFLPGSSSASCNINAAQTTITCSGGSFAVNQEKIFTVAFATGNLACSSTVTNTAQVRAVQRDLKLANNKSTAVTTANCTPALEAKLRIAQVSTGSWDNAIPNQKDITLIAFKGKAENADVLLTGVQLTGSSGTLPNGENYTLWADTNDDQTVDTIVESGVAPMSGLVTFTQFQNGGFIFPIDDVIRMEVHADIVGTLSNPPKLDLVFARSLSNYVEAERLDTGAPLVNISTNNVCASSDCDIFVSTASSKVFKLQASGDLYVSKSTTPIRSRMLLGGELSDSILQLLFHAENEDIDVTDLQFTATSATLLSVDRLELFKLGTTVPFATASVAACGSDLTPPGLVTFCAQLNSGELIVNKGEDLNVVVRARMKTDVDGAVSSEIIRLFIHEKAVSNNTTGEGAVRARGVTSGNNLIANNGNSTAEGEVFIGRASAAATNLRIIGQKHVSVLSKITAVTNANPDANGTSMPTGVYPIGQFKFTAAAHKNSLNGLNKVTLTGVIFNVNATNVNLNAASGQFKIYNKSDANTTVNCTAMTTGGTTISGTASGSFLVKCVDMIGTINTAIDQGTDQTFVLQGNITNPKTGTSTSSLQVSLQNFSIPFISYFHPFGSHFLWLDQDNLNPAKQFLWFEYPETVVNSTAYQS